MRLILLRHGQTPSNVAGALDTAFPGAGLTELGHRQAGAVPDALAHEDISAVYASPLVRTQLTAGPLARERSLEVVVRDGLEEISAGALEMRSDEESVHAYLDGLSAWMHRDLDHRVPDGPSGHTFVERYDAAIRSIAAASGPGDTVAAVSHGAAVRVYAALAARIDPEEATSMWIMNTGMAVLEGSPDEGWDLAGWSSTPVGGAQLADTDAHDVTGEEVDEED